MKKILVEEINRIHELMSIRPNKLLIMEAGGIGGLGESIIKSLEKLSEKAGFKEASQKLEFMTKQIEKSLDQTQKEALERISKSMGTYEQKLAAFSKFVEQDENLLQKTLSNLKRDYQEGGELLANSFLENTDNIILFDDMLEQSLLRGGDETTEGIQKGKDLFKDILVNNMGIDSQIVEKYLEKTKIKYENGKVKLEREVSEGEHNLVPDGDGIINSEERIINQASRDTERGTQKGWEKLLNNITAALDLEDIQTYIRSIKYFFKNQEELALKFNKVADRVNEKIKNKQRVENDIKELADILIAAKRSFEDSYEFIYKDWVKNVPIKVRAELERYGDKNKFKSLFDRMNKYRDVFFAFTSEWEAYKKMFKILRVPGSKTPGSFIFRTGSEAIEGWKRLGMFITTMDPRYVSEWVDALMSRGIRKDVAMNFVFRFLSHAFVFPAILYSAQWVGRAGVSVLETLLNIAQVPEALKLLGFGDGKDINLIDYNEENERNRFVVWKKEWLGNIVKHFPSNSSQILNSATQFTLIDDFFDNVVGPFILGKIADDEYRQKINEFITKSDQEFEKWLSDQKELTDEMKEMFRKERKRLMEAIKKNQTTAPAPLDTVPAVPPVAPRESAGKEFEATPQGFNDFLKTKGFTGQETYDFNPSDSIGTDPNGIDYYYDTDKKTFEPIE